jgi:hypothetical protein
MKNNRLLFSILLLVTLLFALACTSKSHSFIAHRNEDNGTHKIDYDTIFADNNGFTESEVIDKKIEIAAGTFVGVLGVDGSLEVETYDGNVAEIHIVRMARNKAKLETQRPTFEYRKFKDEENYSLDIRCDATKSHLEFLWQEITGADDVRSHVTLKLPRNINFSATAINGRVNVAAIDGRAGASSINGSLTIAKTTGFTQLFSINGNVKANIAGIDKEHGIRLGDINGDVDLHFLNEVNAKINAKEINGRITANLPKIQVEKQEPENYQALVGTGGPEIFISKLNGNVSLATVQKAETKKSISNIASDQLAKVATQ